MNTKVIAEQGDMFVFTKDGSTYFNFRNKEGHIANVSVDGELSGSQAGSLIDVFMLGRRIGKIEGRKEELSSIIRIASTSLDRP